jgi:putative transcriptional regulator
MDDNFKGQLLVSTETDASEYFYKTVIYICQHNEQGAWGVVLTVPFDKNLNDLIEFNASKPFPLFEGGPVEKEKLFFLHRSPSSIEGGQNVNQDIYWGGNFKEAVAAINNGNIDYQQIKLFIGYCGWDKGQLENEVSEGYWKSLEANSYFVFNEEASVIWQVLNEI